MTKSIILLDEEEFDLVDSVKPLAEFFSHEDTGLMITESTGVILHRKGFGSEQIVYQIEPRFRSVTFREEEYSEESDTYSLLFPYVILLIAYEKGQFRGIRHFYSPSPIYTLDQPLYMPSLPNTNCLGYEKTSMGWVCIYHSTQPQLNTLTEKLDYALERYDPVSVPYNFANMSETDGHTFYGQFGKPEYLYVPHLWEAKGLEEDKSWLLDPDTWIQAKVNPNDTKIEQYDADGEPLTLRRALYGKHYVYYREEGASVLNAYADLGTKGLERTEFIKNYLRQSIVDSSSSNHASRVHPKTAQEYVPLFKEIENFKQHLRNHIGEFQPIGDELTYSNWYISRIGSPANGDYEPDDDNESYEPEYDESEDY